MRIIFTFIMMLATLLPQASARAAESLWFEHEFVKMRLISASETAGTSNKLSLGLEMKLQEGWKTYWRTPGDAGLPPTLFLDPGHMQGAQALLRFPVPKRFSLFGLDTFGYAERVIFPIDLTLGKGAHSLAQDSNTTIKMTIDALVCSDICVPVQAPLSLSLPAGAQRASIYQQELAMINAHLPKQISDKLSVALASQDQDPDGQGHLIISVDEPLEVTDILLEGIAGASFSKPEQIAGTRTQFLIRNLADISSLSQGDEVTLTVDASSGAFETSVSIQGPQATLERARQTNASLPYWLIALLGGFILNFMPCVLPVLSIKVASVIQLAGVASSVIRRRFLMSAAGIISSFILIAIFLQMMRLLGGQIGWGIQFQSPVFLGFLVFVTSLFTLSLFDVVTFRTPAFVHGVLPARNADKSASSYRTLLGDFGAGMLATVLATPCSAPFVGTAISFALSQSDLTLYGMMVMMGIGLALPWLILAAFPQFVSFLPRPGQWMVRLKQGLGIVMAVTVLWIASLFWQSVSPRMAEDKGSSDTSWIAYDADHLRELISQDRLIFVDVTADWCITCKANKALVLDTAAVSALFAENDVVTMRADWTYPDEAIASYLSSHERFGIPFNVVYGPNAPAGVILPEILSTSAITKALAQANR